MQDRGARVCKSGNTLKANGLCDCQIAERLKFFRVTRSPRNVKKAPLANWREELSTAVRDDAEATPNPVPLDLRRRLAGIGQGADLVQITMVPQPPSPTNSAGVSEEPA